MNEILKKLLEANLLTEETKNELDAAIQKQLDEAIAVAKTDAHASVTAELTNEWITERDTLIEALDTKVSAALEEEIADMRADIERFRDLEAEYAEKIVEAKAAMAVELKSDISELIEKMDSFLEVRMSAEMEELREDIDQVKKLQFGKRMFEAFQEEYKTFAADDSTEAKLNETEARLEDSLAALEESEKSRAALTRSITLEKVLAPLSGRAKEVMEAILKSVETSMLEEGYKTYVGRVLKEANIVESTSEKESKVLAEGKDVESLSGVVKSGDNVEQIAAEALLESKEHKQPTISNADMQRLRNIAGLN